MLFDFCFCFKNFLKRLTAHNLASEVVSISSRSLGAASWFCSHYWFLTSICRSITHFYWPAGIIRSLNGRIKTWLRQRFNLLIISSNMPHDYLIIHLSFVDNGRFRTWAFSFRCAQQYFVEFIIRYDYRWRPLYSIL